MSYIEIENLTKSYDKNQVLKNIHIKIQKGQLVTLLGPSGCGKSTLLRCLAGLEEIDSGNIYLDKEDITKKAVGKRNVGMVFQQYSLFPNMNVEQNIAFGLTLLKLDKEEITKRVKKIIELVDLKGKEKEYPITLSGGQQQRVALARSIVVEPKVLLLDEPLSAIDAKLRKSLQQGILEIHRELNLTTIFVTHDQDEALVMSDTIHLFNQGQIEQTGSPVAMYTTPKTKFAASFIGNYNIVSGLDFSKLTGEPLIRNREIGIRPETISLSKNQVAEEADAYVVRGRIKSNSPRGNVLRYLVDVNGVNIHADVLFRSFTLYENGSIIFLSIPKKDCLELA
jgi:putative spermidine/putrescine transport system ATP-binding protein